MSDDLMKEMQRISILKRQVDGWERAREAAQQGNPYATLCRHCYGRHAPPMDEICPYDPPKEARAALEPKP